MSATTSAAIVLAVMVAAFVAAKLVKLSTELALFAAALAGALAGGNGIPARMIVEGAFTDFDIVLIFVTATLFMNLLKESGGVAFVVRRILARFHRQRALLLALLALLLLVPGALTGAGSVTVLMGNSSGRPGCKQRDPAVIGMELKKHGGVQSNNRKQGRRSTAAGPARKSVMAGDW